MILQPNMVLPGNECPRQESVEQVADATVTCLLRAVPAAVLGVAFLSRGQSSEPTSACLNAMNVRSQLRRPWALSFSHALQSRALKILAGQEATVAEAQQSLYHRVMCNRAARRGTYDASMETDW